MCSLVRPRKSPQTSYPCHHSSSHVLSPLPRQMASRLLWTACRMVLPFCSCSCKRLKRFAAIFLYVFVHFQVGRSFLFQQHSVEMDVQSRYLFSVRIHVSTLFSFANPTHAHFLQLQFETFSSAATSFAFKIRSWSSCKSYELTSPSSYHDV